MSHDDATLTRLRAAAAGPSPQAWYELASMLVLQGETDEAATWHRRAAEAGLATAQIEYARMLLYGVGVAADPGLAMEWLLRAESAGNPVAGYFLVLAELGDAAFPRDPRSNQRLLAAVQAGYPPALRAAAIHFGRKPGADDQTLCLQLLERAAGLGDAVAARLLAERLARGEGCMAQPAAAQEIAAQLATHGIGPLPQVRVATTPVSAGPPGLIALEEVLRPVTVQEHSAHPRVRQADDLLSADECRLLIACTEPRLRRSQTVNPDTGLPEPHEMRTSSDASFDPVMEDLALRLVQLRMARAAGLPLTHAEHLTVLRYAPGEEYRPHRDYRPPGSIERDRPQAGNRLRTICVYLNEVEAGGETEFPVADLRIAPQPGRAVIFDNLHADGTPDADSLHAGRPVRKGEKWLATLWLRQAPYRLF